MSKSWKRITARVALISLVLNVEKFFPMTKLQGSSITSAAKEKTEVKMMAQKDKKASFHAKSLRGVGESSLPSLVYKSIFSKCITVSGSMVVIFALKDSTRTRSLCSTNRFTRRKQLFVEYAGKENALCTFWNNTTNRFTLQRL